MARKESQTAFFSAVVPKQKKNANFTENYAKNICIFRLCVLYCMGIKINHQKMQNLGRKWFVP
jgi:hypothetical protein